MDYYIYKIACKDQSITEVYVGSTKNLKNRIIAHKSACNNNNKKYNYKLYNFIRDNGSWENWEFIIIETICCNNKKEALLNEKKWIIELNATLNKKLPTRTDAEYYEDNKEQIKAHVRLYKEENMNIINDRNKKYRETHKEQIKERNNKYRENNKEQINERQRERRRNNPK